MDYNSMGYNLFIISKESNICDNRGGYSFMIVTMSDQHNTYIFQNAFNNIVTIHWE